jgi:hypothetical protein
LLCKSQVLENNIILFNIQFSETSVISGWRFWFDMLFYDATLSFFRGRSLHYTLIGWIVVETNVMSIAS